MSRTFLIYNEDGCEAIKCLICGMVSYSQGDIDNEFCAQCNEYHSVLRAEQRRKHPTLTSFSRGLAHAIDIHLEDGLNEFEMSMVIEDFIKQMPAHLEKISEEIDPKPQKETKIAQKILNFFS